MNKRCSRASFEQTETPPESGRRRDCPWRSLRYVPKWHAGCEEWMMGDVLKCPDLAFVVELVVEGALDIGVHGGDHFSILAKLLVADESAAASLGVRECRGEEKRANEKAHVAGGGGDEEEDDDDEQQQSTVGCSGGGCYVNRVRYQVGTRY